MINKYVLSFVKSNFGRAIIITFCIKLKCNTYLLSSKVIPFYISSPNFFGLYHRFQYVQNGNMEFLELCMNFFVLYLVIGITMDPRKNHWKTFRLPLLYFSH